MEYRLKIGDDDPVAVRMEEILKRTDGGTMKVFIDGRELDVSFAAVSDRRIHLEIDGGACTVYVADDGGEKEITIDGTPYFVHDADLLERKRGRSGGRAVPTEVTPPMPAVVIRVLVNVGDTVKEGDGVVVVSAMKMETTLFAPYSGTVVNINVSEGDKVEPGQILVDIEKEGNEDDVEDGE